MHPKFYNYDGDLPKLEGFIDDSWHNDVCPSLLNESRNLKLWVDYVNPEKRECNGLRYTLCLYNNNQDEYKEVLSTESLADIEEYLK